MNIAFYATLIKPASTLIYSLTRPRLKSYFLHRVLIPSHPYYYYHKANEHLSVSEFEERIKFLRKHNEFISIDEYINHVNSGCEISRNKILLTFDDGYRCLYSVVFPLMKKYSLPVTVFLTTGSINEQRVPYHDQLLYSLIAGMGKKVDLSGFGFDNQVINLNSKQRIFDTYVWLSRNMKAVRNENRLKVLQSIKEQLRISATLFDGNEMLTWEHLKEMLDSGLLSIGTHTVTHPILARLNETEARDELLSSKYEIESRLGIEIKAVAYPNGRFFDINTTTLAIVKESYALGFCTAGCSWRESPYTITRYGFDIPKEKILYMIDMGLYDPFKNYNISAFEKKAYEDDPYHLVLTNR